jgi:hypothetical protein
MRMSGRRGLWASAGYQLLIGYADLRLFRGSLRAAEDGAPAIFLETIGVVLRLASRTGGDGIVRFERSAAIGTAGAAHQRCLS